MKALQSLGIVPRAHLEEYLSPYRLIRSEPSFVVKQYHFATALPISSLHLQYSYKEYKDPVRALEPYYNERKLLFAEDVRIEAASVRVVLYSRLITPVNPSLLHSQPLNPVSPCWLNVPPLYSNSSDRIKHKL